MGAELQLNGIRYAVEELNKKAKSYTCHSQEKL